MSPCLCSGDALHEVGAGAPPPPPLTIVQHFGTGGDVPGEVPHATGAAAAGEAGSDRVRGGGCRFPPVPASIPAPPTGPQATWPGRGNNDPFQYPEA